MPAQQAAVPQQKLLGALIEIVPCAARVCKLGRAAGTGGRDEHRTEEGIGCAARIEGAIDVLVPLCEYFVTVKKGNGRKRSDTYKYSVSLVVVRARAIARHYLAFAVEIGSIEELEVLIAQVAAWCEISSYIIEFSETP